ncbi:MAG: thioredoxin [Gammaproteobacteria bacterium]|jgi:predicted dithiol-disulfide oxidoreductase (DUF899 family)|nr:thioredoxin [Gammaproteobacteria bacterium]
MATSMITTHPVVSPDEWTAARRELLQQEKQLTHARDALNEQRGALPWVKVEKQYSFDTVDGKTLADLFEDRSQRLSLYVEA